MDAIDEKLLLLLRRDARQPSTSLAAALGISRGTVQNRMARLLADGVIEGFTLRLPEQERQGRVRAITLLAVMGERSDTVARALRRIPDIRALHSTNGRWDLVAELETADLAAFDAALSRIRKIEGISATETSLLLASIL